MKFGPLPPGKAHGGILAHALHLPDGSTLRKGRRLGASEVTLLERLGIAEVTVAVLEASDVSEDEAAWTVARAVAGPGTEPRPPGTGRSNVIATESGLLAVDVARIRAVNEIDESVTVSTLRPDAPVRPGTLVATVKVIPFAVPETVVDACASAASGSTSALGTEPFRSASVALVLTTVEGLSDALLRRGEAALLRRVERLGSVVSHVVRCPHDPDAVAGALHEALSAGCDLLLVLGASAVGDRTDVVPEGVHRAGGCVLRLGIPTDPGNLTLLAEVGDTAVIGVPGCGRSPRRNGFDWILERVLAGRTLQEMDVPGLGVGGLLKETSHRPQPRRARARDGVPSPRVAGVVLAAGRSARMGAANKLLQVLDGVPMVRRVAEIARRSRLNPLVVVLGHEAEAVRGALAGLPVTFVENPDYASGMSSSIACGIAAVAGATDGAMILLGDMPWVSVGDVNALLEAFEPEAGRGICAPVVDRRRGNPVVWAARYFPELRTLEGDVGARHLLTVHDDDVCEVPVAGNGVVRDVDTPEALASSPPFE